MKCSRIALLLVLTVLGGVAVARATEELMTSPLSNAEVLRLLYLDVVRPAEWFESATDWRDNDTPTDARDDSPNAADEEATSRQASSEDDSSSGSDYNGYYGNDANAIEMENAQKDERAAEPDASDAAEQSNVKDNSDPVDATERPDVDGEPGETNPAMRPNLDDDADRSNTAQQSNDEEGMSEVESKSAPAADEPNTDDQQSSPAETSDRETQADDDMEFFDVYGVEYVYCSPQEKFATRVEMAAVCCSMLSRLADWAALSADDVRVALGNISERIVQIDWNYLTCGASNGQSDQADQEGSFEMEDGYR
jgi:hypothetical protein